MPQDNFLKKNKSTLVNLLIGFTALFFVLVGLKIFLHVGKPVMRTVDLNYALSPSKTNLKLGETVLIPIYLTGKDASSVSAYDIRFYYDNTKFKMVKTVPGNFFSKYITVKWDSDNNWYALAMTPSTPKVLADPTSPLFTVELMAIAKSNGTPVSTGNSIIYVSNTGGISPKVGSVNLTIK